MAIKNLESEADYISAIKSGAMVVVDCTATWCGPCKMITPHYEKFSDDYPDVDFYKLDIDKVPDVARELNVRAVPTFTFFKAGEQIGQVQGADIRGIAEELRGLVR